MKRCLLILLHPIIFLCLGSAAYCVKPFPKDPILRAKALERYKKGLKLYSEGQKLHEQGKFEDANTTYGKAMEFFGDGPKPDMANSYNRLGNEYLTDNPYFALWYYGKALSIRRKDHGREHESVASSFNNVGMVCIHLKEYDRAIAYFEAAMGIFSKVNPKQNNGQVASCHNRIGSAYLAQKKFQQAVSHYEKGADMFLKTFGQKHPNVARAKRDLGFAYLEKGEKKKALDLLLQAKDIFTATEGAASIEAQELTKRLKKLR